MSFDVPVGHWMEVIVDWALNHLAPLFDAVTFVIGGLVNGFQTALTAMPIWLLAMVTILVAAWRVGLGFALFSLFAVLLIVGMGLWAPTMATFALILAATRVPWNRRIRPRRHALARGYSLRSACEAPRTSRTHARVRAAHNQMAKSLMCGGVIRGSGWKI